MLNFPFSSFLIQLRNLLTFLVLVQTPIKKQLRRRGLLMLANILIFSTTKAAQFITNTELFDESIIILLELKLSLIANFALKNRNWKEEKQFLSYCVRQAIVLLLCYVLCIMLEFPACVLYILIANNEKLVRNISRLEIGVKFELLLQFEID